MQQLVESFGLVYNPDLLRPLFRIVTLYFLGLLTLKLIDSALKRVVSIVPGSDAAGSRRLDRRAVVDVSVARKEELGRVFAVLAQVGDGLAKDMQGQILDEPVVVGVEKLTGAGTKVRVGVKTLPSKHDNIEHEWRRRIKEAFDK